MPQSVDSRWLFELESHRFDALGHRIDTAGLPRWSNPDTPNVRDGNHASVREGEGLIPDQLVQVFDAQARDGAPRCVDIYGAPDARDALCTEMGLIRTRTAGLTLVAFRRSHATQPLPAAATDDRPAPPVTALHAREWIDAVTQVRRRDLVPYERDRVMGEAAIPSANFYAIRIGDSTAACIARYDWETASQIASIYVDPAFRKTGFATACINRAIHDSPHDVSFGLIAEDNAGMLRVAARAGAASAATDIRRRYIEP